MTTTINKHDDTDNHTIDNEELTKTNTKQTRRLSSPRASVGIAVALLVQRLRHLYGLLDLQQLQGALVHPFDPERLLTKTTARVKK